MPRERIDLSGFWRFQPDPAEEGTRIGYPDPETDVRRWNQVRLPATFEACTPALDAYEGACWFRRTVVVPEGWAGRRVTLRCAGANYHTDVWVNGRHVGRNDDPFLPFEFAVGDAVRYGAENVIVTRVDNVRRAGEVPGTQRGWRTFGGILREVELEACDPLHLAHVTVVAEPGDRSGQFSVRARVRNDRPRGAVASISVHLTDAEGRQAARCASAPTRVGPTGRHVYVAECGVPGVRAWSPAEPNLYSARVTLLLDGEPVDECTIRVGFRTIRVEGERLLLNGKPIYLTGFNRHEDLPLYGPTVGPPDGIDLVRRDLLDIKAAGANFVRLCHYPHHPVELDLCDELGLLAMDEIPLYWWRGREDGESAYHSTLAAAKRQLTAMIRRDVNHPSVIAWSVSNETDERRAEVVDGNRELVCLARELDPTRPAVHVSCHWQQDPHFEADDIVCVNAYPSLNARGYGGRHDYEWAEGTRFWRERLKELHAQVPGKPILVTEFGYASFRGVFENAFGEDAQACAIEAEFAGMDAPYVCGATIWCWADHPWPQATFAFCGHLGISPYGVVTRDRRKLQACHIARRLFRARQGTVDPPRSTRAGPGRAGYSVNMIRPHLRDIPEVPFPPGFRIRPMRLDEGGLWTDIWRDAEPYFDISDDLFQREFGFDPQAVPWRCFLIVDERGVAVGTISAWYDRNYRGQDYGRIHWVATRRAYQGKGLGRAGLSYALRALARWHDRAVLDTQTRRLLAIRLYLDFGFLPDLEPPGAVDAWREVQAQLKHPALERALAEHVAA